MRSLKERSVPRILLALLCANAVVPSIGKETFPNGLHRAGHEGSIDEGSIRVLWPAESAIIAPGVAVPFVFRVHEPHWVTTGYTVEVTMDGVSYAGGGVFENSHAVIRGIPLPALEEEGAHVVEVRVRCEDGQWEAQTRAACRVDWQRGTTQWSQGLLDLEGGNRIWNVADWCCIPHWAWQIDTDHPDDIDTAVCCTSSIGRMFALAADSRGHDISREMVFDHRSQEVALLRKPTFHASMSILVEKIVTHILKMGLALPYPAAEVSLMAAAIVHARPDFVFEWGTNSGCSARIFFEAAQLLQLKTVIHSTDLPAEMMLEDMTEQVRGQNVRGRRFEETVRMHVGDGLNESMAAWKEEGWVAARVLWYLDGDHSEQAVRRELDAIASHASCVREPGDMLGEGAWSWPGDGCYILMHDTHAAISKSGAHSAAESWWQGINADRFGKTEVSLGSPGMTLFWPR